MSETPEDARGDLRRLKERWDKWWGTRHFVGWDQVYPRMRNFYRNLPIPRLSFWWQDWLGPFGHELFFEGPSISNFQDIPKHVVTSMWNLAQNVAPDFNIGDVNVLVPSYLLGAFDGENLQEKNPMKYGYITTLTYIGTGTGFLISGFNPVGAWAGGQIGGLIGELTWAGGEIANKFITGDVKERNSLSSWLGFGKEHEAIWTRMWEITKDPSDKADWQPVELTGSKKNPSLLETLAQGYTAFTG